MIRGFVEHVVPHGGVGLTVAEAMWKARPVVASRIGGIQDQIVDGRSGILLDEPAALQARRLQHFRFAKAEAGAEHAAWTTSAGVPNREPAGANCPDQGLLQPPNPPNPP